MQISNLRIIKIYENRMNLFKSNPKTLIFDLFNLKNIFKFLFEKSKH